MTPSPRIIDFIKAYEKLRLKAYAATEDERKRGIWSIGYGHTEGVKEGDEWTIQQVDDAFAADLTEFSSGVAGLIGASPTTQNQFDAMVSLAYNIGLDGLHHSTVLVDHRAENYGGAAGAFGMWIKQSGQVLQGLVSRRAAEAAIYSEA